MARKAISQDELLQLINAERVKHDDCRNLKLIVVKRTDAKDGSANWRPSRMQRSGHDNDSVACDNCLRGFFQQLYKDYDVNW